MSRTNNQALDFWGYLGFASDIELLDEVAVRFTASVDQRSSMNPVMVRIRITPENVL